MAVLCPPVRFLFIRNYYTEKPDRKQVRISARNDASPPAVHKNYRGWIRKQVLLRLPVLETFSSIRAMMSFCKIDERGGAVHEVLHTAVQSSSKLLQILPGGFADIFCRCSYCWTVRIGIPVFSASVFCVRPAYMRRRFSCVSAWRSLKKRYIRSENCRISISWKGSYMSRTSVIGTAVSSMLPFQIPFLRSCNFIVHELKLFKRPLAFQYDLFAKSTKMHGISQLAYGNRPVQEVLRKWKITVVRPVTNDQIIVFVWRNKVCEQIFSLWRSSSGVYLGSGRRSSCAKV